MATVLKISVEGAWRGPILDTVTPICKLPLVEQANAPGRRSLRSEYRLQLKDGSHASVWCAWTAAGIIRFSLTHADRALLVVSTQSPFSIEAVLPDGKQYQFTLLVTDA